MRSPYTTIKRRQLGMLMLIVICGALMSSPVFSAEKWQGVDEVVIEKIAREHGREASGPLINPEQGDLMLFVFLGAGSIGGFVAGYYWRALMEGRRRQGGDRA